MCKIYEIMCQFGKRSFLQNYYIDICLQCCFIMSHRHRYYLKLLVKTCHCKMIQLIIFNNNNSQFVLTVCKY